MPLLTVPVMRFPLLSSVFLGVLLVPAFGHAWDCGDALIDERDDQSYATVLIGDQCWMQQNMNVGTMTGKTVNQTDNGTIEKYCYADNTANCVTYGGLYQWNEATQYATNPAAQGICPTGWHIPTHDEWTTLERAVCTSDTCEIDFPYDTVTTDWRGTNEGTTLQNGGFETRFGGFRYTPGAFFGVGTRDYFWSSVKSGTEAWSRYLNAGDARVRRYLYDQIHGFSVRCLQDPIYTTVLHLSSASSIQGQTITLVATVTPFAATGTITFYRGDDTLGTVTLGHGSGSLTIDTLGLGAHSFTAVYSGDGYFPGSSSAVVWHTVNPPPPPPGGGRGSGSPGRGGDAPLIDIATRRLLPDQPSTVSPLYGTSDTPSSPRSPMLQRLAARIEQRIALYPRLRPLLLKVLERAERRLEAWKGE